MINENNRTEEEVFNELSELCIQPGYIHIIAYICFRDNSLMFNDEINAEVLAEKTSTERLIRTEISTIIGLMLKSKIDYSVPNPTDFQAMIDKTDELLKELHNSIMFSMNPNVKSVKTPEEAIKALTRGINIREPIFYNGESAYMFQYQHMANQRYSADKDWLNDTKGFTPEDASLVFDRIANLSDEKLQSILEEFGKGNFSDEFSILPAYQFNFEELSEKLKLDKEIVKNVVRAFTIPEDNNNDNFTNISEFNIYNAYPILRISDSEFISFQYYSLVEAFYEAPYYWFLDDKKYLNTAMENRGKFTENFSRDRLIRVFGSKNVYSNIDLYESSNKKVGEIDVLVVFANRAIILQAKSKRLTVEARKGNDRVLKDDFQKAIQHSYDQGYECAINIENENIKLIDADKNEIKINRDIKEIYILCVVSDNYPGLCYQTRQFLKIKETEKILPPFIMDVFLLDVMTEMLSTPLYLLSYIKRRAKYHNQVVSSQELTILSYHLQNNLWLDPEFGMLSLFEDIAYDLDAAMMVRRENFPGKDTPEGILTRFIGTPFDTLIKQIEDYEHQGSIELGFMLLSLSEEAIEQINQGIEQISYLAKIDKKHHDFTVGFDEQKNGLTIHCNFDPKMSAEESLIKHCTMRKYRSKADDWFGIIINPITLEIEHGMSFHHKWEKIDELEKLEKKYFPEKKSSSNSQVKVGRNDKCPCNSGLKFKKCCGKL